MNCLCELSHFHLDINSAYSVLHIDVHYVLNLRLNVQFDTEAGDNNMRTASGVMSRRVSLAERARESGSDRKCGSMEQSAPTSTSQRQKLFVPHPQQQLCCCCEACVPSSDAESTIIVTIDCVSLLGVSDVLEEVIRQLNDGSESRGLLFGPKCPFS